MKTTIPESRLPRDATPHQYAGLVRQCSYCRRTQPWEAFNADPSKAHGVDTWCKLCCIEQGLASGPTAQATQAKAQAAQVAL